MVPDWLASGFEDEVESNVDDVVEEQVASLRTKHQPRWGGKGFFGRHRRHPRQHCFLLVAHFIQDWLNLFLEPLALI